MRIKYFYGCPQCLHCWFPALARMNKYGREWLSNWKAVQYSGGNGKEYAFISRPYRTSELSFRVGGPIDRFDVYSGNYYSQGSIIAEIDPRDFRIRKERTKAIYEQMKTEFDRIQKLYERTIFLPANMKRQRPIILRPRPPLTWLRTNWKIHVS